MILFSGLDTYFYSYRRDGTTPHRHLKGTIAS
jgi:hypothetical protein